MAEFSPILSAFFQYVYSIDFLHFMFSSVGYAFLFLSWIFVIIPSLLSTVQRYKPKDFLGYISAALFWCICGFLVVLSPVSLVAYLFYLWLYKLCKKRKASKNAARAKAVPPPPVPPSSVPPAETAYYMEAANGMTVRVPASKLDAWQAEQERIKNDPAAAELTEDEKKLRDAIIHDLYKRRYSSYKGSEHHD